MSNYKKYLESKGFAKISIKQYHQQLLNYLTWCDTQNIEVENTTHTDILGYIKYLQNKGIRQSTVVAQIKRLSHYYDWLNEHHKSKDNPIKTLKIRSQKTKSLHQILSKSQLAQIYTSYKLAVSQKIEPSHNYYKISGLIKKRNQIIIGLYVYQAIRLQELKNLTTKDIELRKGEIHIPSTRTSKARTLQLEATQILDLMEYMNHTRLELQTLANNNTSNLFITKGKHQDLGSSTRYLLKQLKEQFEYVYSYKQIRASVITSWIKNYNLRKAQYMAGHKYVSSTESYLINDIESLQEDINKYHPI